MSDGDTSPKRTGLRERKKERARLEIQRHALRLFREQGFHATTVEQVAEAAEVAPSTVFRYFPRKQDLARIDRFHSLREPFTESFRNQPAELTALEAVRAALREALASLEPTDRAARSERDHGLLEVPELWSANAASVIDELQVIQTLIAERARRDVDDPAVRGLTASILGLGLEALIRCSRDPELDLAEELDQSLGHLAAAATM
ncbi:TetR/AcrR family transcriptional regulator [Brevibacterium aurantiacum]|uniref:TetR family transcriptional regulator n=1 Tax=Brevibacterium aurantiacum TaxID=273384 RepID=A0A4Z0KHM5_BREAU|nr:TetR family transcriptional regulator [Brevibacterium aurantiacum]TGD38300.1 TetR family transcriptional regulator [Brevibacterium aurantiacum]